MPRRQLTKPQDLKAAADELPDLTDNQQRFVQGILDGLTASDAYRAAYDCSNAVPNTIWAAASKLAADTKVKQWLAAARRAELGAAIRTKDQHVRRLDRLQQIALDTGNVGAAVQAEHYIGKVGGYYVERYEDLTPPNPLPLLERLASLSPKFAEQIAGHMRLAAAPVLDLTHDVVTSDLANEGTGI